MNINLIDPSCQNQNFSGFTSKAPEAVSLEEKIMTSPKKRRFLQDENGNPPTNFSIAKRPSITRNHIEEPPKEVKIFLNIKSNPFLQCCKNSFCSLEDDAIAPHSFADWTDEKQIEAVNKLSEMRIPLKKKSLLSIYKFLQKFQDRLCKNPEITYPARYHAVVTCLENQKKISTEETPFDIEIHSDRKAALIFPGINKIQSGTSKVAYRVFTLGNPQIRAYTETLWSAPTQSIETFDEIAAREERSFIKFHDKEWIAKVYRIFYYNVTINDQVINKQVIEMKYYQGDLFDCINSENLSNQVKLSYSIQLMQALTDMHGQRLIHRDIKPENILVDRTSIALTDFGTTCEENDLLSKIIPVGTKAYISPELIIKKLERTGVLIDGKLLGEEKIGFALDIWSAGCTLWLLWQPSCPYPWYNDASIESPNFLACLDEMKKFDQMVINPERKMLFLIWNMLRYEPEERWSARQVLDALQSLNIM